MNFNNYNKEEIKVERKLIIRGSVSEKVELLKAFDPDTELKAEFEVASLEDLQKYLDWQ